MSSVGHLLCDFSICMNNKCDDMFVYVVPIWLSGNALVPIYLVTLRQVRLVHGWVTVL